MKGSALFDPKNADERKAGSLECCAAMRFKFCSVIDTMDDKVAVEYAAWPERLFVVDKNGKIVYAGGQGPWGFDVKRKRKGDKSLEGFLEAFLANDDNCKASGFKVQSEEQ